MPAASSLILPYAVAEKNRKGKFDENMEFTAILCLAEARRKKHEVVGSPQEKVRSVSKLHYPLWAVPWENACIITDGLQVVSSTLTYMALPDLEAFFNDVERGKTNREQFGTALSNHVQTFSGFSETVQIPMGAVVADKALLTDVLEYVEETVTQKAEVTGNIALVGPQFNEEGAKESAKKVVDLYERILSDVKGLEKAAQVLNEATQFHEQKILREIELATETSKEEVERIKPSVERKVELLLKERDAKIEKMNRTAEAELNAKQREKERRQRELEKLEYNRAQFKRKLDSRKTRHDKVGVGAWEHRLRSCESRISEVRERIHDLSHYIEKTCEQNQEDINNLKYTYQTLLDRERKKITDIEVSLELVIKAKQGEKEKLWSMTHRIVGLIERLVEQKRLQAAELKNLAIPWKLEEVTLLGVPFYLVSYKGERKLRYELHSPVRAMSSEGIVKKIEKTLLSFRLVSRIRLLLQSRSKTLDKMFGNVLREKMKTDSTLEGSLRELAATNNLLMNPNLKKALTEGVEALKTEGWIQQEEGVHLIKTYTYA